MRIQVHAILSLASLLWGIGCGHSPETRNPVGPYEGFCCQQLDCPEDVEKVMRAHGFDCVGFGGSFGGTDISIRGTQEDRFRARELVLRFTADRGWKIGWLADARVERDHFDQIGAESGPWKRVAAVEHRVTPTPNILALIKHE